MASKRGGLGRGLGALFGDKAKNVPTQTTDVVREIPVAEVHPNPYQPRQNFDPQTLQELADSIKTYGVLQPIIVRKIEEKNFELIAGERRLRAAKIINLEKIPAIIREYTDLQASEIAIIENVQRQNLNAIEEAQAYQRLIEEFGYTQEKIAKKIGLSRSQVANTIRLLKLAPQIRELVSQGKLSTGQVRPLLSLESEELQLKAAEMVLEENLTAKAVELFMREFKKTINLSETELQNILSEEVAENISDAETIPAVEENISDVETVPEVEENFSDAETIPEVEENISDAETIPEVEENISDVEVVEVEEIPRESYVKLAENKLAELLNTPVKIVSDSTTNQIQITFSDDTQLLRIIRNLDRHITPPEPETPEIFTPNTKEEKIAALRKFSTEGSL